MDQLKGFDWDAANLHPRTRKTGAFWGPRAWATSCVTGVTPFEVEEVARRPHVTIPAKTIKGEARRKLFGKTTSSRHLVVVFTIRRKLFRTVTAYEMNAAERRKYAPQIG